MSHEKNSTQQTRSRRAVTSDDFVRFLVEKNPESNCPVCDGDAWTVVCPFGDHLDTYRLVVPMRDGPNPMTISTFAIFCDNCGYLRQHLARVVHQWVEANPVEQELDFESEAEPGTADAE